jgi:hypothetical protein
MLCYQIMQEGKTLEICYGDREEIEIWSQRCGFDLETVETKDSTHRLIAGRFGHLTKDDIARTLNGQ